MHLGAGRAEIMAMPTTLEETRAAHERRFRRLAATWKAETELVSKVTKPAIPLILKDLSEHGPDDWFWALTAITDDNPITEDISGDMQAMAEAWLQWGRKAGYLSDSPSPSNGSSQT
jgi:hypothetical protein